MNTLQAIQTAKENVNKVVYIKGQKDSYIYTNDGENFNLILNGEHSLGFGIDGNIYDIIDIINQDIQFYFPSFVWAFDKEELFEKDTLVTVGTLVKKIKNIIKTTKDTSRKLWVEFLGECRKFIRAEKKRLARKWAALRFAASEAKNLHVGLTTATTKELREVFRTIMFANLEGYLIWCKKEFANVKYEEKQYTQRNYNGGLLKSAIETSDIPKVLRWYAKTFFPSFKFSITKRRYASFTIVFDESVKGAREAAKQIGKFGESFNYDYSDPMTDYFNTRFYLFVQNQNGLVA